MPEPARSIRTVEQLRSDGWLTVDEAAGILGRSARTIRWQCQRGALAASRFEAPTGAVWLIDPSSRAAFRVAAGRPSAPAIAGDPLAGLSAAKRAGAHRRYRIVQDYLAALACKPERITERQFTGEWLDLYAHGHRDEPPVSPRALQMWKAKFARKGVAGLIDGRAYHGRASWTAEARDFFIGQYLDQARPHIPALYERMEALAAAEGWAIPSLRTVQRFAARRLDPKLAAAGRDPKKFRDRCLPHVERDWSQVPAMGCWIADHRQFDVLLPRRMWNEKRRRHEWRWYRPWLTAYLDGRTWMPAAWSISFDAPDGNRTMATFVRGVIAHGTPETLYLDNGKDFRTRRLAGGRPHRTKLIAEGHVKPLLDLLGVQSVFAIPYNAKAKTIEPWFSTVAERFDKTWETYCGRRADLRPERLKAMQHKSEAYHDGGLTLEAFCAAFDAWVTRDYALRKSPAAAAGGLSAARAFAELRSADFAARRPARETLMLLLMPSLAVSVRQNGIYVRAFGQHYWSDELEDRRCGSGRDLARKVIYRYDPDDSGAIYVFDASSDKFLCVATPYVGGAIHPLADPGSDDAEQLEAAIALQRSLAKRTHRQVSYYQRVAGNRLLAASRQAAGGLGRLDDAATIPAPAAARIAMTDGGELDRAALAADEQRRRRQNRRPAPLRAADLLAATGTEDDRPTETRGRRHALDLLLDKEPDHVRQQHPEDPH